MKCSIKLSSHYYLLRCMPQEPADNLNITVKDNNVHLGSIHSQCFCKVQIQLGGTYELERILQMRGITISQKNAIHPNWGMKNEQMHLNLPSNMPRKSAPDSTKTPPMFLEKLESSAILKQNQICDVLGCQHSLKGGQPKSYI